MPAVRLRPDLVLTPDGWRRDVAVAIVGGRVAGVAPAAASQPDDVTLPGRALLPGTVNTHCHAFQSLLRGLGDDLDFEVVRFDPGPPEPDMGLFPTLAGILERADPGATATPLLMPGVSDARFFARLGIQNYGFLPMKLPPEFDFWSGVHGADERVPAAAVEFGAAAVYEALARFGEAA